MATKAKVLTFNVSELIDERFGKKGTTTRIEAEKKAYMLYIGQVIVEARKRLNISQAELARRTGYNQSYISRLENSLIDPDISKFHRIINALEVQTDHAMYI